MVYKANALIKCSHFIIIIIIWLTSNYQLKGVSMFNFNGVRNETKGYIRSIELVSTLPINSEQLLISDVIHWLDSGYFCMCAMCVQIENTNADATAICID